MNKYIFAGMSLLAALTMSAQAKEERMFIRVHGDVSLTKAIVTSSSADCVSNRKTQCNDYGVDFAYMFYRQDNWRLSVGTGVSITPSHQTLALAPTESNYDAPASADMDGNTYVRYVTTSEISQKVSSLHVGVPLFLDVDLRAHRLVSVYGQIGFRAMFKAHSAINAIEGTTSAYGMYPQYDNLIIDQPIMNAFGETRLSGDMALPIEPKAFVPEMLLGLGVRVNIYKPLWLDLGLNYRYSGNFVKGQRKAYPDGKVTDAVAPVTYTVADGLRVNPPTHYLIGNFRNTILLSAGLMLKF